MARPKGRRVVLGLLVFTAACNTPPTPGLARGQALFKTCAQCHGPAGAGNQVLGAPAIAGLPRWYLQAQLENFAAGRRGNTPHDTTGIRMKSIAWTLDRTGDLESVAEYVATLATTNPEPVLHGGDAAAGQATFQVCLACHGADAMGIEAVHAPPLAGQSDWYLLAQLRKFKTGMRGTDSTDMWGQAMRPNAMMPSDTTMMNVVAYIQTLRQGTGTR